MFGVGEEGEFCLECLQPMCLVRNPDLSGFDLGGAGNQPLVLRALWLFCLYLGKAFGNQLLDQLPKYVNVLASLLELQNKEILL